MKQTICLRLNEIGIFFLMLFSFQEAAAQYPPQAGMPGSTAIPRQSPRFTGWADHAELQRGWINIADKSLGKVSAGTEAQAIGPADFQVVSLGDSGVITLRFDAPLYNGPGPDFAVFENGFRHPGDSALAFLEFAFVEVSDNGRDFYRFPAYYKGQEEVQIAGAGEFIDARQVHNLAGKYLGGFGTPFDLEDLAHIPGLNLNQITHVRLVDVIGRIDSLGSLDSEGRRINDPYPTDFPVGGFDLDAVGALYQQGRFPSGLSQDLSGQNPLCRAFPNPCRGELILEMDPGQEWEVHCVDPMGRIHRPSLLPLSPGRYLLDLRPWGPGGYLIHFNRQTGESWTEKIIYSSLP